MSEVLKPAPDKPVAVLWVTEKGDESRTELLINVVDFDPARYDKVLAEGEAPKPAKGKGAK